MKSLKSRFEVTAGWVDMECVDEVAGRIVVRIGCPVGMMRQCWEVFQGAVGAEIARLEREAADG
jgi:ABC-type protease/lipase transport system fused ATPase/permease subunit